MKLFGTSTTVFDVLRNDHDEAKKLMNDIADADSNEERSHLFAELKQKLDAHAEAEEAVFYPRLRNEEDTRELILEADTEHKLTKQMLHELERSEVDDEWVAKFTVLKHMVEHHIREEERQLFPVAKRIIDKDEAQNMAAVVQEEKEMRLGEYVGT